MFLQIIGYVFADNWLCFADNWLCFDSRTIVFSMHIDMPKKVLKKRSLKKYI